MFPIRTKNRKAISAVLTTIIILVASIVLGTGVVIYSTNLFQTGGQSQSVQVQGVKAWVNGSYASGVGGPGGGIGWGAFAIKNTGDKIVAVTSIVERGTSVPFTKWYVDQDQVRVGQNFQAQFNFTKNDINGDIKGSSLSGAGLNTVQGAATASCTQTTYGGNPYTMIVIQETPLSAANSPVCLAQLSGPFSLTPGSSAIVYYKLPINLMTPSDGGVTTTISILAGAAPVQQTVRVGNP